MKDIGKFIGVASLLGCLTVAVACDSPSAFKVGSSVVSIEPADSLFSLTLAGYGAPAEGRFSMAWERVGEAPGIVAMAGNDRGLYGADASGKLYAMETASANPSWQPVASAGLVKHLAAMGDELFAVSTDGDWLHAKCRPEGMEWAVLGSSSLDGVVAITSLAGRLYVATNHDCLMEGRLDAGRLAWRRMGEAQSVLSLAGFRDRLFALTSNQILWRRSIHAGDVPWTKTGYNNGKTYDLDLCQIAVSNGRLYAIGTDGLLYAARHRSNGNLTARAVAIGKGDETVVMVGLDLTGFDYSFIEGVKSEIRKQTGMPPEAVLINASHTHFAPVTQGWYSWIEPNQLPDTLYLHGVVKPKVVQAVSEAVGHMRPARLSFASSSTHIGGNRCLPAAEAVCDSTLDVVKVEGAEHEVTDVIFLAGCHPVFRNAGEECFTLNANFPAVAREVVMRETGAKQALFLQGCAGDINPLLDDYRTTGEALAADVLSVLRRPMEAVTGGISYYMDSVLVPIQPWTKERILRFKSENMAHRGDLEADKNVRWADIMLRKYEDGTVPGAMTVYVQTLNVGNWKIVGLSREAVTQYGQEIRKLWPDQHVSVAGYCNDVSSYLPAASHVKAQTYEGTNSFFWYSQPGFFPEDVLEIVVSAIKGNRR